LTHTTPDFPPFIAGEAKNVRNDIGKKSIIEISERLADDQEGRHGADRPHEHHGPEI
jgi:hypothetical protein